MMGDWCRQVSWLTAHAHRLRLPAGCPAVALGATLAAYSCGGSRGFEDATSHRVPFSPTAARTGATAGPSRAHIEAKRELGCQQPCGGGRQIAFDRCLQSNGADCRTNFGISKNTLQVIYRLRYKTVMPWQVDFHPDFLPEFEAFSESVQNEVAALIKVLSAFGPQLK